MDLSRFNGIAAIEPAGATRGSLPRPLCHGTIDRYQGDAPALEPDQAIVSYSTDNGLPSSCTPTR